MKSIPIFQILFVFFYFQSTLSAQKVVRDVIDFGEDYGWRCEGDSLDLGFRHEISSFDRKTGVCGSYFGDIITNKSSEITVSGPGKLSLYNYRSYRAGSNEENIKVLLVSAVLEESGEIIVTSRSKVEFDIGEYCPPDHPFEDYILERIWIFRVKVIKIPPIPELTAERFISSDNVNLIASGCPTDTEGYYYEWNELNCPDKPENVVRYGNFDGRFSGQSGKIYRVKCGTLNGTCVSQPSKFVRGLTYNKPSDDCVPDEIQEQIDLIESIINDGDKTYHHYDIQNAICDETTNNNCSVSNVYDLMLTQNQFISPVPTDIQHIKIPLNDFFYAPRNKPVESCKIIKLPSNELEKYPKLLQLDITNPVMTYVDRNNQSVINYTIDGHLFYPGRIIRQVVKFCNKVYVITIGEGKNSRFLFPEHLTNVNQNTGPLIFNMVDNRLKLEFERIYK